jgi:hypothetical protein
MTDQEIKALFKMQQAMGQPAAELADKFAKMLENVPPEDLDRELNNIGHILMLTLKKTAVNMPEAMQFGLPYAFIRLVGERMKPVQ